MPTMKHSETTEITPMTIKWPAELDIKPIWTVDISKNYEAQVFKSEVYRERRTETGDHTGSMKDAWCLRIVNKKTGFLYAGQASPGYRNDAESEQYDLLSLRNAIIAWTRALAPKTKTVKVSQDEDE